MEFKDRIKELRRETSMTTTTLAHDLGKSDTTIRMWETGKSKPDADKLIEISSYFGCSVDYLLGLSDFKNKGSQQELESAESEMQKTLSDFSERKSFLNSLSYFLESVRKLDDTKTRDTALSLVSDVLDDCGEQAIKCHEMRHSTDIRHDSHNELIRLNEQCEYTLRTYRDMLRRATCRIGKKKTSFGEWYLNLNSED